MSNSLNPCRRPVVSLLVVAAVSVTAVMRPTTTTAQAGLQAGRLDLTFGSGGKVITPYDSLFWNGFLYAYDLAIQEDGKIIVVGDGGYLREMLVARYLPDGNLDTGFGPGGTGLVFTGFADLVTGAWDHQSQAASVAIQPDGRIVVGGVHSYRVGSQLNADCVFARFMPDGTLDSSFGEGGRYLKDLGGRIDTISGIVLQEDGNIVASGYSGGSPYYEFATFRLHGDGSFDPDFGPPGSGGVLLDGFFGDTNFGRDVTIQADGTIVVVGSTSFVAPPNHSEFAIVRYDADGMLESKSTVDFSTPGTPRGATAHCVANGNDGTFVVGGFSSPLGWSDFDFALARFDAQGNLDTTFGSGGFVSHDLETTTEVVTDCVVQPDGKIVQIGYTTNSSAFNSDFIVARFDSFGDFDPAFSGGWVTTNFAGRWDHAYGVALQRDGKIVVAGMSVNVGPFHPPYQAPRYSALALVRYEWYGEPADVVSDLMVRVGQLVESSVLNAGQGKALLSMLEATIASLNAENDGAAAGQLVAFINAVEAAIRSGKLTPVEGGVLIDIAQALIESIEGS